jgi:hypothetical protein
MSPGCSRTAGRGHQQAAGHALASAGAQKAPQRPSPRGLAGGGDERRFWIGLLLSGCRAFTQSSARMQRLSEATKAERANPVA